MLKFSKRFVCVQTFTKSTGFIVIISISQLNCCIYSEIIWVHVHWDMPKKTWQNFQIPFTFICKITLMSLLNHSNQRFNLSRTIQFMNNPKHSMHIPEFTLLLLLNRFPQRLIPKSIFTLEHLHVSHESYTQYCTLTQHHEALLVVSE